MMSHLKGQSNYCSLLMFALSLSLACKGGTNPDEEGSGSIPPTDRVAAQTYVYECREGYTFTARIEGEKAWLFLPTQTLSLPLVRAASGSKFSDGSTLFWNKGDEVVLEVSKKTYRGCKNNRAKATWVSMQS